LRLALSSLVFFDKLPKAMTKIKVAAIAFVLGIVIILIVFFVVGYFKPQKAGLLIETEPSSMVYINGEQVGRTRYETTTKPGEIVVKLVPESMDKPLAPYETKISLVSGVKTIIQRNFAESEQESSGVIVSFEKTAVKEVSIAIISTPDSAQVTIDGQVRGFTPFKSSAITSGEHTIGLSASDYEEKSIDVRTYENYKLTAVFKLAPSVSITSPTPQPASSPESKEQQEVEILPTSTGFLRVRNEPSTLAKEIGQVEPGKKYKLLTTDQDTGWYQIEFKASEADGTAITGWISNQYAKIVESKTSSPQPSPTP
jgi:uncharacterized protein YgiM (DUF1202 family)